MKRTGTKRRREFRPREICRVRRVSLRKDEQALCEPRDEEVAWWRGGRGWGAHDSRPFSAPVMGCGTCLIHEAAPLLARRRCGLKRAFYPGLHIPLALHTNSDDRVQASAVAKTMQHPWFTWVSKCTRFSGEKPPRGMAGRVRFNVNFSIIVSPWKRDGFDGKSARC